MTTIKNPKKVYGGLKGTLRRKLNDAKEYIEISDEYSGQEDEEIQASISGLRSSFAQWEEKFNNDLTDVLDADEITRC